MFERFADGKRRDWKRRALLVGSLGLHGAVVVALVVGAWFHVDELTPPLLAVVFVPPSAPAQQQVAVDAIDLGHLVVREPATHGAASPSPTGRPGEGTPAASTTNNK